ncbi:hypothetical protein KUTeg_005298, partial [Tegillarca granosa]
MELYHGVTWAFKDLALSCVGQFLEYFLSKRKKYLTILVVDGTSDDLDIPIKQCFMDTEFCRKHNLCSINSINWARIMVQTVHYFYAYLQNDIVARTVQNGDFSVSENVIPTLAPAMDIQLPYNMERIWHMVTDGDHVLIKRLMDEFENNRKLKVPTDIVDKNGGKSVIIATASVIKFEEALEAAGITVPTTDAVKSLLTKPTRYQDMNKGDN